MSALCLLLICIFSTFYGTQNTAKVNGQDTYSKPKITKINPKKRSRDEPQPSTTPTVTLESKQKKTRFNPKLTIDIPKSNNKRLKYKWNNAKQIYRPKVSIERSKKYALNGHNKRASGFRRWSQKQKVAIVSSSDTQNSKTSPLLKKQNIG
ncbi:hypothetical protein HOF51_00010 [bacterium]|nr:hypothetical protein [bacterium]